MKNVAVIGAGIFGCAAATELASKDLDVTVYDRSSNILDGASTINHLRHHYGFHYPRSKETVREINASRANFESKYGEAISDFFEDYYGVAKEKTKTAPDDFLKFCDAMGLKYELKWPEEQYMNRDKIAICLKTPERVYDPDILRGLLLRDMKSLPLNLKLNHEVIGGKISGNRKKIMSKCLNDKFEDDFDYVINATYSNFNLFNSWMGFPTKKLQYELVELLELYIPDSKKIGLTIVDGEFSSVLPRGEKGTFTLGHVDASILERMVGDHIDPVVMAQQNKRTNRDEILRKGAEDFPFLKNAKIVNSLFITRVVKANVDATDERPSEITEYGNGIYSIFGGKVITCVDIAKKLADKITK